MNKTILFGVIAVIVIAFALVGLNGDAEDRIKKNKVGATIFPIYDIAREIAGEEMEVVLLLPPGTSPHTFDPNPSLLRELDGARAVFGVGYGLDGWADGIADSVDAPVITLEEGITLRENEETHDSHNGAERHGDEHDDHDHGHEHAEKHHGEDDDAHEDHHGHDHGPIDPHYWLSVENAKQIALNVAEELGTLDDVHASLYMERAERYVEELEGLKAELQDSTTLLSGQNIVSLHDAWYYFADEFGVTIVGTFEPSAGREPTPQYLATLTREVEENNVSTVFMEPQLSSAAIESFARDNDLGIAILDPIGGVDGRDSYVSLMRYNVEQLVRALTE